eukprot:6189846-Pleurochrysis_carterae.AAC.1
MRCALLSLSFRCERDSCVMPSMFTVGSEFVGITGREGVSRRTRTERMMEQARGLMAAKQRM